MLAGITRRFIEMFDETLGYVPSTVYDALVAQPTVYEGYEEELAINGDYVDWDYEEHILHAEMSL